VYKEKCDLANSVNKIIDSTSTLEHGVVYHVIITLGAMSIMTP